METQVQDQRALGRLGQRLKNQPEKIDNSRLYAGSSMYFYCRLCGYLADTLPESYWGTPKKYCAECDDLKDSSGCTDATLSELARDVPEVIVDAEFVDVVPAVLDRRPIGLLPAPKAKLKPKAKKPKAKARNVR